MAAYVALPWVAVKAQDADLVCIPKSHEPLLDGLVAWLVSKAKGLAI